MSKNACPICGSMEPHHWPTHDCPPPAAQPEQSVEEAARAHAKEVLSSAKISDQGIEWYWLPGDSFKAGAAWQRKQEGK